MPSGQQTVPGRWEKDFNVFIVTVNNMIFKMKGKVSYEKNEKNYESGTCAGAGDGNGNYGIC